MPAEMITRGLHIEPNHAYIILAQRDLALCDGYFRLLPISKQGGGRMSLPCSCAPLRSIVMARSSR